MEIGEEGEPFVAEPLEDPFAPALPAPAEPVQEPDREREEVPA